MRAEVTEHEDGSVVLDTDAGTLVLTEHGSRDIEFVLAQQLRARSRRCTAVMGEHTCSLAPGHATEPGHLCRACTQTWQDDPEGGAGCTEPKPSGGPS